MTPLLILFLSILIVVGMIVVLRVNAFLALITAAVVVSLLAPGPWSERVARVATAFGSTAGNIGIVIAMAAIIGVTMMGSGAADRIVQGFTRMLGQERGGTALSASGFVLSIPVFFDTVFYLLIPLARSMYRQRGHSYLKYIMAITAGGAATHSLVPPTPGPLVIADTLGIDIGTMMLIGGLIALPCAAVGVMFAGWLDARMKVEAGDVAGMNEVALPEQGLPSLGASLFPIVLPVLLISANTIISPIATAAGPASGWSMVAAWTSILGNPNMALILAGLASVMLYVQMQKPTRKALGDIIEQALMSGGIIILITAGGGAFGAMLKEAQIGAAIKELFADTHASADLLMLGLGFGVACLIKFAQGSTTVAMITTSAMLATIVTPESMSFNLVYLGTAIGSGALVGSWMNDSGFWIYAKMGGLTETETLKSWTPLLAILGITGGICTVILALILPLT